MDISEIRRRNLWSLAHPHGYSDQGVKLISDKSGKSEQRIRHLIAKDPDTKTAKNIGGNAAREFEATLGLENGWLDHPHPERWSHNNTQPRPQAAAEAAENSPATILARLKGKATPQTQQTLERLCLVDEKHGLSNHDIAILEAIISRYETNTSK